MLADCVVGELVQAFTNVPHSPTIHGFVKAKTKFDNVVPRHQKLLLIIAVPAPVEKLRRLKDAPRPNIGVLLTTS